MGIDLEAGGRKKKVSRVAPKSENVYLRLLVKVGRCCMGRRRERDVMADARCSIQTALSLSREAHGQQV